jgi:hypothetical protein
VSYTIDAHDQDLIDHLADQWRAASPADRLKYEGMHRDAIRRALAMQRSAERNVALRCAVLAAIGATG